MFKRNTQTIVLKAIVLPLSCMAISACSFSGANNTKFKSFKLKEYSNEITKSEFSSAIPRIEETLISNVNVENSFEINEYVNNSSETSGDFLEGYASIKYDSKKLIFRLDNESEVKTPTTSTKYTSSEQIQYEDGFICIIDIINESYYKYETDLNLYKQEIYMWAAPGFIHDGYDVPWYEGSAHTNASFYADKNDTLFTCVVNTNDGHMIYQYDIENGIQYREFKYSDNTEIAALSYKKKSVNLSRVNYSKYEN